jgi:hypothetical protein
MVGVWELPDAPTLSILETLKAIRLKLPHLSETS